MQRLQTKKFGGIKKMAYPMDKYNDGYYVMFDFNSEPEFIEELMKGYNSTDKIIKHITVKRED